MDTGRVLGMWLLVGALLFAQALGLVHRSLHGGGVHGSAHASATDHSDGGSAALPAAHVAKTDRLFGHDGHDTPECRLYDQANHVDLLWAAPAPVAAVPPRPVPLVDGEPQTRSHACAGFHARGPPHLT